MFSNRKSEAITTFFAASGFIYTVEAIEYFINLFL
ncbi:signal transduction histidine-protein kinase [Listeria monocytogenes]|nr:signal transduction histidine-protein kinase [Listeria monocytogenes]